MDCTLPSTLPSSSPISQSSSNYFSFYQNPEPPFAASAVQNNHYPDQTTIESMLSRLNLSYQKNEEELGYAGTFGSEFLYGSGYGFGDVFRRTGQEGNNGMGEGTSVDFDGLMKVGPDTESWETTLKFNSYLLDSSRTEFPILPSAPPGAGCSMSRCCSINRNLTRSSCNSHNTCNNNNNNSFRTPHWLHEPLNCLSLVDLKGRILSLAKDQYGCRFLQKAIREASKEEIDMVFMEIIDHVGELMIDPFANYVVQKVVDVCSDQQKYQILLMIKYAFKIVDICLNLHGARAVQKLLEKLTTQQQISTVMSALSPGAVALAKDMNGHRVIQYCLKNFSDEDNKVKITLTFKS